MRTLPEAMQVGINADLDRVLCHILQLQYITFGLYREENHLKKNRGRDVPFQRSRKMTSLPWTFWYCVDEYACYIVNEISEILKNNGLDYIEYAHGAYMYMYQPLKSRWKG